MVIIPAFQAGDTGSIPVTRSKVNIKMKTIIPQKLRRGDEIRIIAPALSLSIISKKNRKIASKRLEGLGLKVTFGKYIEECDEFNSSSIESRIEDLHKAFADENVKAILTVIGGFNSNQLLSYINWELIKKNPKIFCGYSDITVLQNAIYRKTGLVTYSGPAYSSFAELENFDYTLEFFKKNLFSDSKIKLEPSLKWSEDKWYKDQKNRHFIKNSGYVVINNGSAKGKIIGGNLCTLNLLQGTEFMPDLKNSVLFLEEDYYIQGELSVEFDRNLQSIIHQPEFEKIKSLVIGRFQRSSGLTIEKLKKIIKSKKELDKIPVVANVDFGHITPMITFPIGGNVFIEARSNKKRLEILEY